MELRQLRCFRAVGELHFAHGAVQRWLQPSLSRIPRRLAPLFGKEIHESADPTRHRVALDAHGLDGRRRFRPFGENAHQGTAAQFVGYVPGLAQRNSHPGHAPGAQRIAVIAAQIAHDFHHLSSAAADAVLERPTVLSQAGIGKQQARVLVQLAGMRGRTRSLQIGRCLHQNPPAVGQLAADQPGVGELVNAHGRLNIAAVQIYHVVAQLQIEA